MIYILTFEDKKGNTMSQEIMGKPAVLHQINTRFDSILEFGYKIKIEKKPKIKKI